MKRWLTIIGIGENGLDGLGAEARSHLEKADVIFGGKRHLEFLPPGIKAERMAWPSPFSAGYEMLLSRKGRQVVVLASGDPMLYGVGASLTRIVKPDEMHVVPFPSSFSLAAARMGWPLQDLRLLSVHGRPLDVLNMHILPGTRLLVLSNDGDTPVAIAAMLVARGFGESLVTVLEHLGGGLEREVRGLAREWSATRNADLNVVAVECRAGADAKYFPVVNGLPDAAFEHDGQLTKRDIRAITLSRLAPLPGQLLWDVGAGCGSIGIEWMRSHATCRAIAIEAHPGRQEFIARNSRSLGVPGLQIVKGAAPSALEGLESPDAVFIGGGFTDENVPEFCWEALRPGGRLVANAVTIESEARLAVWRERYGGELTRISISQNEPLGGFQTFRPALPVTILSCVKPLA